MQKAPMSAACRERPTLVRKMNYATTLLKECTAEHWGKHQDGTTGRLLWIVIVASKPWRRWAELIYSVDNNAVYTQFVCYLRAEMTRRTKKTWYNGQTLSLSYLKVMLCKTIDALWYKILQGWWQSFFHQLYIAAMMYIGTITITKGKWSEAQWWMMGICIHCRLKDWW